VGPTSGGPYPARTEPTAARHGVCRSNTSPIHTPLHLLDRRQVNQSRSQARAKTVALEAQIRPITGLLGRNCPAASPPTALARRLASPSSTAWKPASGARRCCTMPSRHASQTRA
jgi:hypothetical protein